MRPIILAALAAAPIAATPVFAGSGDCGLMRDRSAKAICYAAQDRSTGSCSTVTGDARRICRSAAGARY